MILFTAISATPLILLWAELTHEGPYGLAALIWLTLVGGLVDHLLPRAFGAGAQGLGHATPWQGLWADGLQCALALGHLGLILALPILVSDPSAGAGGAILFLLALASFAGQVTHPNAHELIHRAPRALRLLGRALYASLGFGHHASAHLLVHHPHVATPLDPNSAPRGLGFWAYLPKAWIGSYRAGLTAENKRRAARSQSGHRPRLHPYLWDGLSALAVLLWAVVMGGLAGAGALIAVAVLFQVQILMSDYLQHYGLMRGQDGAGKPESVARHHSWNAPRAFTHRLMLAAPLHADHHLNPNRGFGDLSAQADDLRLPYSLPVMAMIALVPPAFRRVMDPRLPDRRASGAN